MTTPPVRPSSNTRPLLLVGACVLAFGALMVLRSSFEDPWARAAIAGCGGACMGVALSLARKHWRPKQ